MKKILITMFLLVSVVSCAGNIDIFEATRDGNINKVEKAIKSGIDVDSKNPEDNASPLMMAVVNGYQDMVEILIELGADVNLQDQLGNTPLIYAAASSIGDDNDEVMKILVKSGADLEAKDNDGYTALFWAFEMIRGDRIKILVELGADINIRDGCDYTPLIRASASKNNTVWLVDTLLEAGADVNLFGFDGATALIAASEAGNKRAVQALVEAGADLEVKDNNGYTALIVASAYEHTEIVEILKNVGTK